MWLGIDSKMCIKTRPVLDRFQYCCENWFLNPVLCCYVSFLTQQQFFIIFYTVHYIIFKKVFYVPLRFPPCLSQVIFCSDHYYASASFSSSMLPRSHSQENYFSRLHEKLKSRRDSNPGHLTPT